jgi:hypothetical protein
VIIALGRCAAFAGHRSPLPSGVGIHGSLGALALAR